MSAAHASLRARIAQLRAARTGAEPPLPAMPKDAAAANPEMTLANELAKSFDAMRNIKSIKDRRRHAVDFMERLSVMSPTLIRAVASMSGAASFDAVVRSLLPAGSDARARLLDVMRGTAAPPTVAPVDKKKKKRNRNKKPAAAAAVLSEVEREVYEEPIPRPVPRT